ncbi:UNVERIFIED_CONTAM: hypothetical protein FKN15_040040 [Acipenser sinensis]
MGAIRRMVVTTDASATGWGAVWCGRGVQGRWTSTHINTLELRAVFLALLHFLLVLRRRHVLIRSDNRTVVVYINHQGGLRSRRLCRMAASLLLWAQRKFQSLRAVHLPGVQNSAADLLSRTVPPPGEWRFHPQVMEGVWARFSRAEVDLFASAETTHCPLWFSAAHFGGPLGVEGPDRESNSHLSGPEGSSSPPSTRY